MAEKRMILAFLTNWYPVQDVPLTLLFYVLNREVRIYVIIMSAFFFFFFGISPQVGSQIKPAS